MTIYKARIENKAKELADHYQAIVDYSVLARDATQDLACLRVSKFIEEAIQDHLFVEKEMFGGKPNACSYAPFDVHERGLKVLEQLRECIVSKKERFEPIPAPPPSAVEEDVEEIGVVSAEESLCTVGSGKCSVNDDCKAATAIDEAPAVDHPLCPERNEELERNIIGIMQLSGTLKNGAAAKWTVDQLKQGLLRLHPSLEEKPLLGALALLTEKHVLIPCSLKNGPVLALSDDYAAEPQEYRLDEEILKILQSATELGECVGWTYNQLIYAVKRTNASLGNEHIERELETLAETGRVFVYHGKKNRYVAIDEAAMVRYREKLIKIGHEPADEPLVENSDIDEIDLNDTAVLLLMRMRRSLNRLWRGYDLEGLFSLSIDGPKMDKGNGKPGELRIALVGLSENGLVERIPPDTLPSVHEERWRLTDLGKRIDSAQK
ncbi:MAG: hypothetical protein ACYS7Y_26290 [Planctomycetota bacterium]|jgi:hypothetical protein